MSSTVEMLITKAKKPSERFPCNLNQEPTNPWFGTTRYDHKVPLHEKKFVSPVIFIFAAVMIFTHSSEEIQ